MRCLLFGRYIARNRRGAVPAISSSRRSNSVPFTTRDAANIFWKRNSTEKLGTRCLRFPFLGRYVVPNLRDVVLAIRF